MVGYKGGFGGTLLIGGVGSTGGIGTVEYIDGFTGGFTGTLLTGGEGSIGINVESIGGKTTVPGFPS